MKKVAICISGQYRTFDKIWMENRKILEKDKGYKIYYFCFFWKYKGNTHKILDGHNRSIKTLYLDPFHYFPTKEFQKVSKFEIEKIIPNAKIKISQISEKKMLDQDGLGNILRKYPHNKKDAFNSFCLWKSIQLCDQIRIDFEKKNKIKFDIVMRIRPDWKLKKNPLSIFLKKKNKILFFDSTPIKIKKQNYLSVTDVCFVSHVQVWNKVSKLYLDWVSEIKKRGWIKYEYGAKVFNYKLIAETTLFWFLKKQKIRINTNTLGGYGFTYRYNYENRYIKKEFSLKLLINQILEFPKKLVNNLINQL
ncbi:hypothetical protein N8992_01800 [Candidatus Pelagibacter ubique]|nr:hypothetical protein [Candidatus Pelagibacter ubique]